MKSTQTQTQNELHTLYIQGLDFFTSGDITSAKTIGQQLTTQNVEYAPGWYLLGRASMANNEVPQAINFMANAINLDRTNHEYLLGISECLLHAGDFAKAAGFADQALQLNPESKQALLILGQASLQARNLRESYQYYQHYIELDDQNANIYNNLGCIAMMLDNLDQAKQHFEQALKVNPKLGDAYNNLGVIADRAQDLKLATKMYKKGIECNPRYIDTYINLSVCFAKQNNTDEAIEYLDQALKIDPKHLGANVTVGKIFFEKNEYSKAIYYLTKAYNINPNIHEVLIQLAISLYSLREYNGAKNYLLKMLQHNRHDSQALYYLGLVCMALCSYVDANKFFIDANASSPYNIKILHSLAESYIILKYFDKAEEVLKECAKLSNDNPHTDLFSTLLAIEKCDFENAIKLATKLVIDSEKYWSNPDAKIISPYYIKALHLSPELQDQYMKHYESHLSLYNRMIIEFTHHNLSQTKNLQIHLGYLVPVANDYPLFDNIMTMIKEHDKTNMQIFVYRLDELFKYSDREIATKINDDQIDVLIDLCGYNSLFSRPGILTLKPALFQRSWLTSDYSTNNSFIEPIKNVALRVPFCHVVKQEHHKKSYELPSDKFILCGFASAEYLNPELLNCWFDILEKTNDTVLWLSRLTKDAQYNIEKLAEHKSFDITRMIFTGPEKIFSGGPHNLADVILDTLPSKNNSRVFIAIQDEIPIVTFMKFTNEKLNHLYSANRQDYCKHAINLVNSQDKTILKDQTDYFNAREICQEIEEEVRRILKKS
jgi:tetratricopeptide (TPR) repeat protein